MRGKTRSLAMLLLAPLLCLLLAGLLTPTVYADTNGSEIQITDQPDRLILQLGAQWAGVEFELKTDAGVFPAPVVVDSTGILKMDLGGSKTYTLSCLTSPVAVPVPQTGQSTETPTPTPSQDDAKPITEAENKNGIPAGHLILFLGGLAAAAGGLLAMRYFKRRRESYDYGDDDDDGV